MKLSIISMMLLFQEVTAEVTLDTAARALKSTKAPKKSKAPKGTKAPKATKAPKGTKGPKATKSPKSPKSPTEAPTPWPHDYDKELVDARYWNAAEVIDWDKFYAKNPESKVPKVYWQPQRFGLENKIHYQSPYYDDITRYWVHDMNRTTPEDLAQYPGAQSANITGDLFEQILRPHAESDLIPEGLRNKLLWMEDNPAWEEVLTFNGYAWRPQTSGNGRVIGLGKFKYDWSRDPTRFSAEGGLGSKFVVSVQESPCKKWMKLAVIMPEGFIFPGSPIMVALWLTVYVLQPDDLPLKDLQNNTIPDVNPGDLLRMTYMNRNNFKPKPKDKEWDEAGKDPYEVSPSNIQFMYLFRKVAEYDESTQTVNKLSYYSNLEAKVNTAPPTGLTSTDLEAYMPWEKFDLKSSIVSDTQIFIPAAVPPTSDLLDDL